MANNKLQGGGIIVLSLLIAILLMILPLPTQIQPFRPEFVALTLIYWAMATPNRLGIGLSWCIGLLMDILMGGTLGVFAFLSTFIVYFVLKFHLQLRQYPCVQQAFIIFTLILLVQIVKVFIFWPDMNSNFYFSAITSMLLWPVIYKILSSLRHVFNAG